MPRFRDKWFHDKLDQWLIQVVFFAGFFADVAFLIKPHLIHDAFGIFLPYPDFSMDWNCFRQAWSQAAGPIQYVAAFLSQWFDDSFAGALIVTVVSWLICLATAGLIQNMGTTRSWFISLFPACAVLAVYQTYCHPLAALLGLIICLWLAVGYEAIAVHGKIIVRILVFLGACLGLYYLAGSVSLLFGLLVGTWTAWVNRRWIEGEGLIVVSIIVPWWIGTRLSYMTIGEAYSLAWPFGAGFASDMDALPLCMLQVLFVFPLLVMLVVASCQRLGRRRTRRGSVAAQSKTRRFRLFTGGHVRFLRVAGEIVVLAAIIAAIHRFLRTPDVEKRFEMIHWARARDWDEVLHTAQGMSSSSYDCFYSHLVNRSLYHTGRLGDEMFCFSQHPMGLLLLSETVPNVPPKFWMVSQISMELGDVNCAEQWAYQTLEGVGNCPWALETLALISVVKEHPEAARVLLNRMQKNVLDRRHASQLLSAVDHERGTGADQIDQNQKDWLRQVQEIRKSQCTEDEAFQGYSEEQTLEDLLKANPHNKMAFEYLMAHYLLAKRTDKIVENLHRLDDFGYRRIPRHYEEAVLIHGSPRSLEASLHGRRISKATIERFRAFTDAYQPWQKPTVPAFRALAWDFGNSYFFYYVFGISGVGGSR